MRTFGFHERQVAVQACVLACADALGNDDFGLLDEFGRLQFGVEPLLKLESLDEPSSNVDTHFAARLLHGSLCAFQRRPCCCSAGLRLPSRLERLRQAKGGVLAAQCRSIRLRQPSPAAFDGQFGVVRKECSRFIEFLRGLDLGSRNDDLWVVLLGNLQCFRERQDGLRGSRNHQQAKQGGVRQVRAKSGATHSEFVPYGGIQGRTRGRGHRPFGM